MAAAKSKPARGKPPKKGVRGRMPTKRSINLILPDEGKINPLVAIPAILLILVLAAALSKFLVVDRLTAVSASEAKVSRIRAQLDEAMDAVENIGDVEDTYAHYTLEGMTQAELGLVDRVDIMNLVYKVLLANAAMSPTELVERVDEVTSAVTDMRSGTPEWSDLGAFVRQGIARLAGLRRNSMDESTTWNVTGNMLTVNVVGRSLDTMNDVARMLEESPIVDSCVLTTASKARQSSEANRVTGRFIIYLQLPPAEEVGEE